MERESKYTEFYHAFDPEEEQDPRERLQDYIERKEQSLLKYAKQPGAKQDLVKRLFSDISELRSIHKQLVSLRLFSTWSDIETTIQKTRPGECDGFRITIPLSFQAQSERLVDIDYRR